MTFLILFEKKSFGCLLPSFLAESVAGRSNMFSSRRKAFLIPHQAATSGAYWKNSIVTAS